MGLALTESRGGWNRNESRRPRRKERARRSVRILLAAGWHENLLEPRIAPAVLDLTGGVLSYTAASGESNKLAVDVVQVSGSSYIRFHDGGAGVTIKATGSGLIADSSTSVRAPAASVTRISIDTEDQNDTIRLALGVGMPASISVNPDPPPDAQGIVTLPAYGQDQLTIVGPAGADTMALTSQLAADATKDVVLADAHLGLKVALQHMSSLTVDLSASSGQHSVTVDRSITRPDAPLALKVIGGPAGTDSLTVTAPGTIPQTFALTGGSIKTSDVRTGKEIMLGPSDNIAIDQPVVQVNLELTPNQSPDITWPSIFNQFVLDTGASSILAAADATGDLEGSGLYHVYPIQYLEQGVGGYTAMDVSYPYPFDFAGTNGVPHQLPNTKILSSDNLQFSPFGPDGIVGMPAMINRFTNIDMSGWENPQDVADLGIKTDFPTGASIPTNSGHWYQVPVNLVNFPEDGQQPGGPVPTSAPLAMIPVTIRDNGREVTGHFLLDTGAQLSMISSGVAKSLNLDLSHPSDTIDVGGVGGTVTVPLLPVDQLDVKANNGTSLAWTNLQVGVLDLSVPGGPTIDGVFGMDFLTSGWGAKILPLILGQPGSSQNGYFDHVYLDYRNSSSGTGTVIFDVDPSHDTPAPPDPHTLSVSYSSIAAVRAIGGGGSDSFNVTPSQTIAYTVDGGSHPSGGADTLRLVPPNSHAVDNGSTITIPGDKPIAYQNIETHFLGSTTGGSASFVKKDTAKQGAWIGAYGAQGYDIAGAAPGLPSYATVAVSGASTFTWAASTTDPRALQNSGGQGRSATTWYSPGGFTIDVNLADGLTHDLALYALDWGKLGKSERIQVIDPATGAVLDTQTVSSFSGGAYLQWAVGGHVRIQVTSLAGGSAVISGLFLDGGSGGFSGPILNVTPRTLDASLRTAVLTHPVNRFESMLSEIAALRGRNLGTPSTPSAVAEPPPAVAAARNRRLRDEPPGGNGAGVRTAHVSDPVRDESLSLIRTLEPNFPRTNDSDLGAAMASERPSLAGHRPEDSISSRPGAVPNTAASSPAPTFPAKWPRQRVRSPRPQSTIASAANEEKVL